MMKKMAAVLMLTAVFALLFTAAALAGPTNPRRGMIREALKIKQELLSRKTKRSIKSLVDVNVEVTGELISGNVVTFTAVLPGIKDTEGLTYQWGLSDTGRDPGGFTYFNEGTDASMQYEFYSAGDYALMLSVYRGRTYANEVYTGGTYVTGAYINYTVTGDQTIEKKVASVVSECRASTEWQTALNLYDWLTHHAYYDYTYCYYGPDMLFRGYGVCDSYSKDYMLLCQAAGISIERTTGSGHAWNTLMIDGKWYQADPTWDDSGSAKVPVSGIEGHEYFCLNSDIMQSIGGHSIESGGHAASCTSLDANYYIHTGEWKKWGKYKYEESGMVVHTFSEIVNDALNQGVTTWTYNADSGYENWDWINYMSNGEMQWLYMHDTAGKLLVYGLEQQGAELLNGGPVRINAVWKGSEGITFSITGWNIPDPGILALPADLTAIEDAAFHGVSASTVTLPPQITSIGAGAFADSDIRTVYFSGQDVRIADDAFSGCERLIFVTDNEGAIQYAADHDYLVIAP